MQNVKNVKCGKCKMLQNQNVKCETCCKNTKSSNHIADAIQSVNTDKTERAPRNVTLIFNMFFKIKIK